MRRFDRFYLLLCVCVCVSLAGCIERSEPPVVAAPPKVPEVLVDRPTFDEITDYEDFTGRTTAIKTIDIRARVTGYLKNINFKDQEGRDLEEGFVLYEIDSRPYEAEADRARANLLQASARHRRLELDHERATKLQDGKERAIMQAEFDLVTGDKDEATAAVKFAEAELKMAELQLSFTKVKAPISGRVSRTQIDPGNIVKADETLLTTIVAMDPMYAYFEVDERTLLRIQRYAREGRLNAQNEREVSVQMGLADEPGYPHQGMINFLDNRVDPSTGTLQIRGVFGNADRVLSPGLFVRVRLPIGEPYQAILIEEEALGTDQGQKFLYVVDAENRAQYRRVQVGKLQNGRRVILDGLKQGERVVVNGLQRVRPGAVVQPKMVEATAGYSSGTAEVAAAREASQREPGVIAEMDRAQPLGSRPGRDDSTSPSAADGTKTAPARLRSPPKIN